MTAPDQVLTDLLAAKVAEHAWWPHSPRSYSKCVCGWQGPNEDFPGDGWEAHVAENLKLVVEQHTNRQTERLEGAISLLVDRAELLELRATVARVRSEVSAYSELIPPVALSDLRAALEGEQR